jgi:hypothetical protein
MIVRVSSVPLASIKMVVQVGTYNTAAPKRDWFLMLDPQANTHCSGTNMGVQRCGVDGVNGTEAGIEALPSGRRGMSTMPGRAWEDVYPPIRCVGEVAHGGT